MEVDDDGFYNYEWKAWLFRFKDGQHEVQRIGFRNWLPFDTGDTLLDIDGDLTQGLVDVEATPQP